jgi:hypothetical protein
MQDMYISAGFSVFNKYFISGLTSKPDVHGCKEISMMFGLEREYLSSSVESNSACMSS